MAQISYDQVGWEDKPSENTPINALNLGKMEQGIKDCVNKINGNLFASDGAEFKFSKSGSNYGYLDAGGNFVPFKTTHTETKTLSSSGTTDMGVDHKYRYVNSTAVYNGGYSAGYSAGNNAAKALPNNAVVLAFGNSWSGTYNPDTTYGIVSYSKYWDGSRDNDEMTCKIYHRGLILNYSTYNRDLLYITVQGDTISIGRNSTPVFDYVIFALY